METVTLNTEQGLYVIPAESGFSCLGFDVCAERSERLDSWIRQHWRTQEALPARQPAGTLAAYERYERLTAIAGRICTERGIRCEVDLTQQLTGLEGRRVEVVDRHNDKRRFIVGRSTGWMPIHLEIKTRRSLGGCAVFGAPFKSVRVVR